MKRKAARQTKPIVAKQPNLKERLKQIRKFLKESFSEWNSQFVSQQNEMRILTNPFSNYRELKQGGSMQ